MAFEVPVPRSPAQTLGDIIAAFQAKYGVSRLKVGGAILTAFEAAAASDVTSTQAVFNVLDIEDYARLRGSALEYKGNSKGLPKQGASPSTGTVDFTDTRFAKTASRIYSGTAAPPAGSTTLRVADATTFPAAGQVYVGRGTINSEGPLTYSAKTNLGQYWTLTLSSPTQRFHNLNEEVVVAQGGNRLIAVGTLVSTTRDGRSSAVDFQVTKQAVMLDGEIVVRNVAVSCRQAGTVGNVPPGAIKVVSNPPFPGAGVTNVRGFDNGLDAWSDDQYVDALRKFDASLSRGTRTSILFGVQGATSPEESKRVISASIVRPAGEASTLFIDDGSGYEETNIGIASDVLVDMASGGEQFFALTSRRPIAKAFVKTQALAPFSMTAGSVLAVRIGGTLYEHTFEASDFLAPGSALAEECVSSINGNPDIAFSARTADDGTRLAIFAREETNEDIEVIQPQGALDANDSLLFSTSPVYTLKLYKNDILLYKDGRKAIITGAAQGLWSSMATGIQLKVAVDGTPEQTLTFVDQDFVDADTGYTTVSQLNSVASWAQVFNAKLAGVTASDGGGFLQLESNLGPRARASIVLSAPGGANLISSGMFTSNLGLSAQGLDKDYTLDRMTGEIKLTSPLAAGDSLTVGSAQTRGYLQSNSIAGSVVALTATARLWVSVDGGASQIRTNVDSSTTWTTSVTANRTTYTASTTTAFGTSTSLLRAGDYVIIWDPALNAHGCFRVVSVAASAPFNHFVIERPPTAIQSGVTLTNLGIRFFRLTGEAPQEVRLAAGSRSLTSLVDEINAQLRNGRAQVWRNTYLRLRTNNFYLGSDIAVLTADIEGQKLRLPLGTPDLTVLSHLAALQSGSEVGTPWFASTSYVTNTNGDLWDAGADTELGFEAVSPSDITDNSLLAYFMRRVPEADSVIDRFGIAADHHYVLIDSAYTTLNRFRLRKNDIPVVLDSLSRSGTTVTATTPAAHRYAVGDLVWIQYVSVADGNFASGVFAVTAVPTPTTFTYTSGTGSATAAEDYAVNLWDGTLEDSPDVNSDGFVLTSPYAISPRDTLNFVLNGDEANQSYSVAMGRRLRSTSATYGKATPISVVDADNDGADIRDLFGTMDVTYFQDFLAYMRARTISHKNSVDKSVIWRSRRFGPESHQWRIRYANPRIGDTQIGYSLSYNADRTLDINLHMPHGTARSGTGISNEMRFTWVVTPSTDYKQVVFTYSAPTISGFAKTGFTVTATTATTHGFNTGDIVYVSASTNTTIYPNGPKLVLSTPTATSFTYADNNTAHSGSPTAVVSSAAAAPSLTAATVGDIAIIAGGLSPVGSWRLYARTSTTFTVRVPVDNAVTTQTVPTPLGLVANLVFAPIDTGSSTAADYVDFVTDTDGIQDMITGTLLGTGATTINTSTADEFFQDTDNTGIQSSVDRWAFTDGVNQVLTSDISTSPATIEFKTEPSTVELQSDADFDAEEIIVVPVTAKTVAKWLATPAISGAYATTDFEVVGSGSLQAASRVLGSTGGIYVTGGLANDAQAILDATGENYLNAYGRLTLKTADVQGLVGDAWVALANSEPTAKVLSLTSVNTMALGTDGRITFDTNVWVRDAAAVVTAGDMVSIQRVGAFVAYIFQSSAVLPAQAAVGNWIDFQVASANASNRGRRRILGVTSTSGYKVVWVENDSGISETVEVAGNEIEFYTADSVLPGDVVRIGWAAGGFANNMGDFVVTSLGTSGTNVIVNHAFTAVSATAIGTNLTALRVTETGFRLVERIDCIGPNGDDDTQTFVTLYPQASSTLVSRLNPNLGATLTVLDKLGFPDDPKLGADGYSISTGLIGQVAKILYGDLNAPTIYPGLVAEGATIYISGSNIKRIRISLQIRVTGGVPEKTIQDRVRAAVASEINRTKLGQAVDFGRLVAAARKVQGVTACAVLSPTFNASNDQIAVQANERPFVYNPALDIGVTVVS